MKIGIVNTGSIGRALARAWAVAGHELLIAKGCRQTKFDEFLLEIGGAGSVTHSTPREAAAVSDIVLFSAFWPRLNATLADVVGSLAGKVVIVAMNPVHINVRVEHSFPLALMAHSLISEELARRCPKARVVKAFCTLPASGLDAAHRSSVYVKTPIFVASNDRSAKRVANALIRDAGFQPLDAGPLLAAGSVEQFGILQRCGALTGSIRHDASLTSARPKLSNTESIPV